MNEPEGPSKSEVSETASESAKPEDVIENGDLEELLSDLPESKAQIIRVLVERSFHGPLPPPEVLRDYGEVIPGLPDKIVEMAENEQKHRHDLEQTDLGSDRLEAKRGQYLGAVTMWLLVLAALLVTFYGYWQVALAFLAPAVVHTVAKVIWRN